jgi:DNA polymerase-3 subunit epsilon
MKTFLALDTETTDLTKTKLSDINLQPHMTEIYCVKFDEDFQVIDEFESLVKPPIPIPEFITKITGIDDNSVKNAPTFIEIYDELSEFFTGVDCTIGHNVNFDLSVLEYELKRIGYDYYFSWSRERHCTVELSFPIENKRLKLSQLYHMATGKHHEGSHRAKADTIATVKSYKWLKENDLV